MVPKVDAGGKQKGWRVVVDYRAINKLTVRDQYPLPVVDDIIDRLQGKRIINVLGILSGYWSVPMLPEHRERTAMSTPAGHWQMKVMPMGLTKMAFAGTTTIVFAMMNVTKIVPYYFLGQFDPQNLRVAAMLLVPAVAGVYVGYRLTRVLPDKVFFGIVTWALLGISCKLIWDGLLG